jgi:hypothetical protein
VITLMATSTLEAWLVAIGLWLAVAMGIFVLGFLSAALVHLSSLRKERREQEEEDPEETARWEAEKERVRYQIEVLR